MALDVAGGVEVFVEELDGPQEGLGALVLDHAGADAEAEAAGQRLALRGAGEEVQGAGAVGEVDRAVGEDRDGVEAGGRGELLHLAVHVDAGRGDDGGADVGAPGGAFEGGPGLARAVAGALGAFAEFADAALDGGLDRGEDGGGEGGVLFVGLHGGEELGFREGGRNAHVRHRGQVGVAEAAVPGVEVGAVLRADPGLGGVDVVAELLGVGQGRGRVPGRAGGGPAVRGEGLGRRGSREREERSRASSRGASGSKRGAVVWTAGPVPTVRRFAAAAKAMFTSMPTAWVRAHSASVRSSGSRIQSYASSSRTWSGVRWWERG
ncbi:hypothetical protein [Streptomyces katrae]|uniref:hypothetical protein n=1 Tax=Streptomyces katrae TaxID=68223 RepID=UPI003B5B74B1